MSSHLCACGPAGLLPPGGGPPRGPGPDVLVSREAQRHQVELREVPGGSGRDGGDEVAPERPRVRGARRHPPVPAGAAAPARLDRTHEKASREPLESR